MSMGKSKQRSRSRGSQESFVDPGQVPFLNWLRVQGQGLAQDQMRSIGSVADQLSGRLGGIGGGLLGMLSGEAGSFAPGFQQVMTGLTGRNLFADQAAGVAEQLQATQPGQVGQGLNFQELLSAGPQLDDTLGMLDQAIQRNLASTTGTLAGQASLVGGAGGGRQQFLTSQAAQEAQRTFARGATDILSGDLAARRGLAAQVGGLELGREQLMAGERARATQGQQAAGGLLANLAGLTQSGLLGAGQLGLGQQQQNVGAALGGLGQLGGLMQLGLAPFQAQFAPLMAFADILGTPTVLSRGQNVSRGSGSQASFGF